MGNVYRQEYYACEAEDLAEVVGLDESVSALLVETSPVGVGFALEVDIKTASCTELTAIRTF